jgi:hypothetical protein
MLLPAAFEFDRPALLVAKANSVQLLEPQRCPPVLANQPCLQRCNDDTLLMRTDGR